MAVSHQSGTILHHWNDAPTKFIVKNKSAASSTTSLVSGIPTPPATPSQESAGNEVAAGLRGLLNMESGLAGRNREMVFARIRALIKSIEEGKVSGSPLSPYRSLLGWVLIVESQCAGLEGILGDVMRGEKGLAREGVVRMMSEERGIAAWGTALRLVIENLCL